MKYVNDILKDINNYREKDKLTFFVGAGISRVSGCVGWNELVKEMANDIEYGFERETGFTTEEYLKIPQIFYNEKGKEEYVNKVRKCFDKTISPNSIHRLLMRINPYHLITTNYDDLLEQASNIAGINYSVINSDSKVGKALTPRYILKVHGDFEEDNFVLKEQDYLDYEHNFKLIDNVMKTIVATNMIVFIGYQLADYNIKLILNWVQNVQKDSFTKPVFIYVENKKLSQQEINYYENKGLRILCAYDLTQEETYEEKYKVVLEKILLYREMPINNSPEEIISYVYNKLQEVDEIEYLRASDFCNIFEDVRIDEKNIIKKNDDNSVFDILYRFWENEEGLSELSINKMRYIKERIDNSGIVGEENNIEKSDFTHIAVRNKVFTEGYQYAENSIRENYRSDIETLYDKAYNLCMIGKLDEAYKTYIKLLEMCTTAENWIKYVLVQANLSILRNCILQTYVEVEGERGCFKHGIIKEVFDVDFIQDVNYMKTYIELPTEVKKYKFLRELSPDIYYSKAISKFYEITHEIYKLVNGKIRILDGFGKYNELELKMKDQVNFVYNNKLIFSIYNEHKKFVRISMHNYLMGEESQMKLDSNNKFKISFEEFVLICKNFRLVDLKYLLKEIEIKNFVVDEEEKKKFEKYVLKNINYFENKDNHNLSNSDVIFKIIVMEEIKAMCFLAMYILEDPMTFRKVLNFEFDHIPSRYLNDRERMENLSIIYNKNEGNKSIILECLEDEIEKRIVSVLDETEELFLYKEKKDIEKYVSWIQCRYPEYRSNKLKQLYETKDQIDSNKVHLFEILKDII